MIQLDDIRVSTGPYAVFGPISFALKPGKWHGVIGPAGAGKSLLARIIAGVQKPDAGKRVMTIPADQQRKLLANGRGLRFLPGTEPFDLALRTKDVLHARATLRGYRGRERRELLDQAISRWFLEPIWHRTLGGLPRAVRRRVAVAEAFLGSPKIVILDDPFWGCDDLQIRNIRDGMSHYASGASAVTLVMTTRSRKELQGIVDDVLELAEGGVVKFDGPMKAWLNRRADAGVFRLVARGPGGKIEDLIRRVKGVFDVMWHEGGEYNAFEVRAEISPKVREMIFRVMAMKNYPIVELSREENPHADAAAAEAADRASSVADALKPKAKGTTTMSDRVAAVTSASAASSPPVPAAPPDLPPVPVPPPVVAAKAAPSESAPPIPVPPPPAESKLEPTPATEPKAEPNVEPTSAAIAESKPESAPPPPVAPAPPPAPVLAMVAPAPIAAAPEPPRAPAPAPAPAPVVGEVVASPAVAEELEHMRGENEHEEAADADEIEEPDTDFAPAGGGNDLGDVEAFDDEEVEDFSMADGPVESDTKIYAPADLDLLQALIAESDAETDAVDSAASSADAIASLDFGSDDSATADGKKNGSTNPDELGSGIRDSHGNTATD